MTDDGEDYVVVNIDILRTTPRAIHARCADNIRRWIPKSVIFGPHEKDADKAVGELRAVKVFRWFATKENIPTSRERK